MTEWKVIYTARAEQDLRSIFEYIAFSLFEPEIAKNQVRRIMDAIDNLNEMPLRHPAVDIEPWRSKGLRVMPVDRYLAFYLPVEAKATVSIIRIMYGGRDIDTQLREDGNRSIHEDPAAYEIDKMAAQILKDNWVAFRELSER